MAKPLPQPRQPGAARLDVRNLAQKAGGRLLLDGVTFTALAGECVGLLGPSGSGKSTLLKACCGLTRPADGEILLDGEDLHRHRDAWRPRMGYVPQDDIIHTELALRPALEYAARLRFPATATEAEVQAAVDRVLTATELTSRADVRIQRLSGGQRKRASMGVELLLAPPVLLLDEPTSGLDPDLETTTMALLRRLADEGRAVLTTTHAMASIDMAHGVVVIMQGHVAFAGTPAQAIQFFQVPDPDLIFKRLKDDKPTGWASRYRQSPIAEQWRGRPAPAARKVS